MSDDFDDWNEKKKMLHLTGKCPPYFRKGEIWWAHLGKNISTETNGKGSNYARPILILQRVYGHSCIIVPLTSIMRDGDYYFNFFDTKNNPQCALLTQIKYLDGKRLMNKFSQAQPEYLEDLVNRLIILLKK